LRESIRADILIKLINLMLRSAECELQSYYNLLKEAGITWKKLTHRNPIKNDELVKAKKNK